jgi:hypothetical protein
LDELDTLAKALENLAATSAGFERVIRTVEFDWSDGAPSVGRFVYPGFVHGAPNIDALVDFLDRSLVQYCIPRSEVNDLCDPAKLGSTPEELQAFGESYNAMKDRARKAFIRARKELKSGGEAGEVLLFILLERLLKAPLLVAKMNLKTNNNQPNFGRDGVHVTYDEGSQSLVLLLGESKLEQTFSKAVDHAIESVKGYLDDLELREHEINVIRSHHDLGAMPVKAQEQLRKLLNPYGGGPPDAGQVHACLIGFEATQYAQVAKMAPAEIEEAFRNAYLKRIETGCALIKNKIEDALPPGTRIIFFLMPFPSLEVLRKTFMQKLGVN